MSRRKRSDRKPKTAPAEGTSVPPHRRLRLLVLVVVCIVGVCALYFTGALAHYSNGMARGALAAHHVDDAADYLQWSRRLGPESAETEFLQARVLRKQGLLDEMAERLRRAADLGLEPERLQREALLAYAQAGQLAGRHRDMDRLLLESQGDGPEILEAYVNGLLQEANYTQAGVLLDTWKAEYPGDPQPYYLGGRIQRHFRDFEQAQAAFQAALDRQADHYPAAYQLAMTCLELNRPAEAVPLLKRCLHLRWNAVVKTGLARAYWALGDADAARPLLQEVVTLPREDVARSYQRVGQPLDGLPAAAELGRLELEAGRYAEAEKWLSAALEANPHDLDTRYSWAIALRHTGDVERSVEELRRVSEARQALSEVDRIIDRLDPLKPFVDERYRIGELYMQHGSKRTAEFWLKSVLHYKPDHADAHRLLADYYESLAEEDPRYSELARQHRARATSSTGADAGSTNDPPSNPPPDAPSE